MEINMYRQAVVSLIGAVVFFGHAVADEAGRIVFVEGDVRVSGKPALQGSSVHEGDRIETGEKSYLYIKTVDNGFFILRPASSGRIVSYKIDSQQPANSNIKLEVTEGVARHISGEAVKKARQNFRLNTPVAAIGVRGTDFTVFTSGETSRIAVHSGGVVVAPFSGTCEVSGLGPCEGKLSKELFASQAGLVLQVVRGQETPQLLRGSNHAPNAVTPPRIDEPGEDASSSSEGAKTSSDLDLTPLKKKSLENLTTLQATKVPEITTKATPLAWGRWEAVLGQEKELDVAALSQTHNLMATNAYYALLRSKDAAWQRPKQDTMGFSLQSAQAAVLDEQTRIVSPATVENGKLQLDFSKSAFSTQIDLVSQSERFNLQSQGEITADGRLFGNNQFFRPTNMAVHGVINSDNASAAYLFQSRLDDRRVASGATHWGR